MRCQKLFFYAGHMLLDVQKSLILQPAVYRLRWQATWTEMQSCATDHPPTFDPKALHCVGTYHHHWRCYFWFPHTCDDLHYQQCILDHMHQTYLLHGATSSVDNNSLFPLSPAGLQLNFYPAARHIVSIALQLRRCYFCIHCVYDNLYYQHFTHNSMHSSYLLLDDV